MSLSEKAYKTALDATTLADSIYQNSEHCETAKRLWELASILEEKKSLDDSTISFIISRANDILTLFNTDNLCFTNMDVNTLTDIVFKFMSYQSINNLMLTSKYYNNLGKQEIKNLTSCFFNIQERPYNYRDQVLITLSTPEFGISIFKNNNTIIDVREFVTNNKTFCDSITNRYKSGAVKSIEYYKDGKKSGEAYGYYTNGQLKYCHYAKTIPPKKARKTKS